MKTDRFVDALDFSPEKYNSLFSLADRILESPTEYSHCCDGKLMATLFYEPSTRTRLSFEAAMLRLGGRTISVASSATSSVAKGESLADTIRTVGGYADIIVMRHPKEGSARLASLYTQVPLINGGDGAREHPTQTLTDLFTIRKFKKRLTDLTVAFCGDLRYGRTVHSLFKALARYDNVGFMLISPEELRLPEEVKKAALANNPQLNIQEASSMENVLDDIDVLYMTRIQKERFFNEEDYIKLRDTYVVTPRKLSPANEDMIIMHPLPRITEISQKVDEDKRAVYFQQARLGMFARMALIVQLLEGGADAKSRSNN